MDVGFNVPQILHLEIFLYTSANAFAIGLISSSLLLINFKTILLADLGPNPGNFEINFIKSSISEIFCIYYRGHLKPGIPNPPVAFEISSVVFDLS